MAKTTHTVETVLTATNRMGPGVGGASRLLQQYATKAAGVVGVATALAGTIAGATREFVTQAGELSKWERRLGASASELSKMQYAARITNTDFNALTVGMQRLQRRVADAAEGNKMLSATLRELGLDAEQLSQERIDQILVKVAERLAGVRDESRRTLLTFRLFDVEGVALKQLFGELPELMQKAEDANISLTDEMVERGEKARRKWEEIKAAVGGALARVGDAVVGLTELEGRGTLPAPRQTIEGPYGRIYSAPQPRGLIGRRGVSAGSPLGPPVMDYAAGFNIMSGVQSVAGPGGLVSRIETHTMSGLIRGTKEWGEELTGITEKFEAIALSGEDLKLTIGEELSLQFADSMSWAIASVTDGWDQMTTNMLASFKNLLRQMIYNIVRAGLARLFFTTLGGPLGGLIGGASALFGGGGAGGRAAPPAMQRQYTANVFAFGGSGSGRQAARAFAATMRSEGLM